MLLRFVLLQFSMFLLIPLFSQETEFMMNKLPLGIVEEFYVLKNNKDIREGTYVRYSINIFSKIVVLESGNYYNNEKTGTWKLYSNNQIKEEFNYINGELNGDYFKYQTDTTNVQFETEKHMEQGSKNDSLTLKLKDHKAILIQRGTYKHDEKVGRWDYYNPYGFNYFSYNYSEDSVLLENILFQDSVIIKSNDSLPVYMGGGFWGLVYETSPTIAEYQIAFREKSNIDTNLVTVSFLINNNGETERIEVSSTGCSKYIDKKTGKELGLIDKWHIPNTKKPLYIYSYQLKMWRENTGIKMIFVMDDLI